GGGLRVRSEGTSHRGARARVEATFHRESVFRSPAALVLDAGLASAAASGEVVISSAAPGEPAPATGAESEETAALWRDATGGGETIAVVGDTGFGLSVDALVEGADVTLAGPFASDTWGSPESPKVVRLTGDARVTGEVRAYGIVVTDVPLHVAGWLMIDGLLLARGGLAIDGALVLNGAFWVSQSLDVLPSGSLEIDLDPSALAGAGDLRPTVLPREAILGAWRELW
ncbi:MAG: hypothetical protein ACREQY_07780, partial [Candidatus Binatia bacterium]